MRGPPGMDALIASQHSPHARQYLAGVKGLGHIIIGAQFQAQNFISILDARCQHDERCIGQPRIGTNQPGDFPAIAVGQHQIQQEEIWAFTAQDVQRRLAVIGRQHRVARLLQIAAHNADNLFIIIDHQNSLIWHTVTKWSTAGIKCR